MALSRPCVDCGMLIPRGSRCRRCQPKRVTPGRGSGADQARFRRETLAKTGGRCYLCGSTERVEAHHVIGLREGGANDGETNGVPLCRLCHSAAESVSPSSQCFSR
jgi:5-methylcytosine-specific restriction endonuclease McrA